MTEIDRIVEQMRAAFEGEAWHGPALMEVLRDVDVHKATYPGVYDAHNIWELVRHLILTQAILLRRIRGENAGLNESDFWDETPQHTEENWQADLDLLARQERELRTAVAAFPASRLDQPLMPAGTSSAYTNFHGHIQHSLYHAGQIALLKKAFKEIPF